MEKKTLASLVKEAREKVGISQRELSRQTGVDNNTIAKIERGLRKKPNILSLKKISFVLHIDERELLELAGYSKEEIEVTTNDYSNVLIKIENKPVFNMTDMVLYNQDEIYVKEAIIEMLDHTNLEELETIKSLKTNHRKKIIKKLKNYKNNIYNQIEHHKNAITRIKNSIDDK